MKHLQMIRKTLNAHTCLFCKNRIPVQEEAIAMVEETEVDGHKVKHIEYYCSMNCYNEQEVLDLRNVKLERERGEGFEEEDFENNA